MTVRRVVAIIAAIVLAIGLLLAWQLPSGYNSYTVRSRLTTVIVALGDGKSNLETACAEGTFSAKQKITDIGLPESNSKAHILRAELLRATPGVVHLRATLMDIYGQPYFLGFPPRKAIAQGSILEFEFSCAKDKKFSARFVGSTVEEDYLPRQLRTR
jgi:hypothetical protein